MRGLLASACAALVLLSASAAPASSGGVSFENPTWSPDGTAIAWGAAPFGGEGAAQVWTAQADGTRAAPLVGGLRNGLFQIAWPQGPALLYDANFSVSRALLDKTHRIVLRAVGSTFTSDATGAHVASACDRCNGPVVLTTVATGKRVRIGGGKGTTNGDPTLSPDGRRVAFVHADYDPATQTLSNGGLFVARTDGTGIHRILPEGQCANWSPRGDLIAFLTLAAHGESLSVVRPDGSHQRVLVRSGPVCSVPQSVAWSPDGTRIAYIAGVGTGRLVLVDVASRRTTTVKAFASVTGLAWAPDSRQLLVTARPSQTACSSLWTVGADGKGAKLVRSCA